MFVHSWTKIKERKIDDAGERAKSLRTQEEVSSVLQRKDRLRWEPVNRAARFQG